MAGLCQVPFCFMGNFNEIVQIEERKGTTSLPVSAIEFISWIQNMELVDLALSDRRLWEGPRGLSDHCPMIMDVTRMGEGPRPFRSLNSWFIHNDFLRMVKEEWRSLGEAQFLDKLKAMTVPLRIWHRQNFGDMDMRINRFEEEIRKVDDMVSNEVHDGIAEARRKALVSSCKLWYIRKEIHWKQMSRSRHAKEMNKNTRYFHNIASARRRNNRINALRIHGRLVRNQSRIKVAIRDFYKDLYHQEISPNIGFRDGLVRQITEEEATGMELMPTAEEIKNAV
ncbi:uncharacterized protein LOC130933627 [Arachis stenosperma]|uniref:uncharacterized protein LOC130933627 n=1 Tax=Arachis stenosperma TaxID=217475 RepID=UPI0025AC94C7|nr:uncharacterized protein LOC130933627 [Arachis stenosperma]